MKSGAGGPCNHCQRTSSPCWRKGPPEKPSLCNACGARYLVKKTLVGYLPQDTLHAMSAAHRQFQLTGVLHAAVLPGQAQRTSSKTSSDPTAKRKRNSAARYSVDDLYVREPRYEYSKLSKMAMHQHASSAGNMDMGGLGLALSLPAWVTNQHVDSCDSSATSFTKEHGDDKSTLDSIKRVRMPLSAAAAIKAEGMDTSPMANYSHLRHFQDDCQDADASVRVAIQREASPMFQRRPRKQAKPAPAL